MSDLTERFPAPAEPDLVTELVALLRVGCTVSIVPGEGLYGVLFAVVIVTAPALPARSIDDHAVRSVKHTFHSVYEMNALAAWLRQVRLLLLSSSAE